MCDAFPGQLSVRRTALDHFRRALPTPVPRTSLLSLKGPC